MLYGPNRQHFEKQGSTTPRGSSLRLCLSGPQVHLGNPGQKETRTPVSWSLQFSAHHAHPWVKGALHE